MPKFRIQWSILAACVLAVSARGSWAADTESAGWKIATEVAPGTVATQPAGSPTAAAVQADPWSIKSGIALSAGSPFYNDISIPQGPSKYMLVYGMSQGYELWNLKTGAKEKTSNVSLGMREAVLSNDGQFIA